MNINPRECESVIGLVFGGPGITESHFGSVDLFSLSFVSFSVLIAAPSDLTLDYWVYDTCGAP